MKCKTFGKIHEVYNLPNLLDIQVEAYRGFLQSDISARQRENLGLQEVFLEVFPLESLDHRFKLEFVYYSLSKPKYNIYECQRRGMSYASSIKVILRFTNPRIKIIALFLRGIAGGTLLV